MSALVYLGIDLGTQSVRVMTVTEDGTIASSAAQRYRAMLQGIAFIESLAFDALRQLGAPTEGTLTVSGGATKSEASNQIRANVLNREISIPRITECAFGEATLAAAHASSLAEVTQRIVRIERHLAPRLGFNAYAQQYVRFVQELARREWLPASLADAALQEAAA